MGQKVNPISLRLQKTNRHFDSCWYDDYNYTHLLLQDYKIKNYYKTVLDQIKYPESRVINLGVPKKNIYNLFYYNPSNSRRKKSGKFQLQNYKEKTGKNKKGFFKQKRSQEDVLSFFSFPKQQYWKNNTFTLAQQRIEEVTPHIIKSDGKSKPLSEQIDQHKNRFSKNQSGSFFNTALTETALMSTVNISERNVQSSNDKSVTVPQVVNVITSAQNIKPEVIEGVKPSNLKKKEESVRSLPFVNTVNGMMMSRSGVKSPKIYCDKKKSFFDINQLVLDFVIKNNNSTVTALRSDLQNSTIQRFFVRYLLAQLYCNYLQNKDNYNTESVTTLSRFLVFFQEKNVKNGVFLKKYRNLKDGNEKVSYTDIAIHITDTLKEGVTDRRSSKNGFFQSTKNNLFDITPYDVKKKKNSPLYNRLGVYSSNLVYKSHLEYTLSKQYSSGFTVNLFRTLTEKQSAFFWVQEIIYYLERKIPFRRIKTQILKEIPHYKHIKGIRIKCSGRVGGRSKKAQRSKTQSVKMGQTSLGVFSSKIDFACKSASTRFGLIGVKVWVCYK